MKTKGTVLSAIAIDSNPSLKPPTSATIFKCQTHNTRSPPFVRGGGGGVTLTFIPHLTSPLYSRVCVAKRPFFVGCLTFSLLALVVASGLLHACASFNASIQQEKGQKRRIKKHIRWERKKEREDNIIKFKSFWLSSEQTHDYVGVVDNSSSVVTLAILYSARPTRLFRL